MHALNCKKGGLVTLRRNELHGGVADLSINSLVPTHVPYNPLINPGRAVRSGKALLSKSNPPMN